MPLPLEGLRVLDFSHALAGPYCTLLLAQYGATVYKVEPPDGGDIGRGWVPPYTGGQASYFLGMNAGKKGLCINLKNPRGRELCLSLAEKVDILVENFRPGTLDRMGLSYAALQQRNPKLIYCSISGYGQNGPARDDAAMDLIMQASAGLISVTGTEAGEQVRCGHSVADVTAGMFAMIGVLLALQARERTGLGQWVDVSMFDALIAAMTSVFINFLGSGNPPRPLGTSFASIVPYRTFPTKDRDVAIACGSEKLWTVFCQAIGQPELATHPDYATNPLRVKNRKVLEPMLIEMFRGATSEEWTKRLAAVGVPCSPVRTIPEVTQDLHAAFRGMFPVLDHSGAGEFPVTGLPVKLSSTPGQIKAGAPLLGEHTRQSLEEILGLTPQVLDELAAAAVIQRV